MSNADAQVTSDPIGEVVRASTAGFESVSHRLYDAPPLGSLVKSGGESPVFGVVGEVTTDSIDPGRRPTAMGAQAESVEDVYRGNPQLERLYSTAFHSIAVGHRAGGRLLRYLPPTPPKIHDRVFLCGPSEVMELSSSLDFMPLLLRAPIGSPDDVTAAFLRQASLSHGEPQAFLVDAGRELADLLAGQLQRLNGILRRVSS